MALLETLTDDFNDNSLNAGKWYTLGFGGATLSETNSRIELSTVALTNCEVDLYSQNTYDLTSSSYTIKIVDASGLASCSETGMYFGLYATEFEDGIYWILDAGGTIRASKRIEYDYIDYATATYVADTHRYLRVRESGGTTYWDYSPDGYNWTNFASVANFLTVTALTVNFWFWSAGLDPATTVSFDDFNIIPTGIKKVSGVSYSSIKKIDNLAIASVKKIIGVD